MAKMYDFEKEKKKRELDQLEKECMDVKQFFAAYMNRIYSNDDGINAQIEFELIPDHD